MSLHLKAKTKCLGLQQGPKTFSLLFSSFIQAKLRFRSQKWDGNFCKINWARQSEKSWETFTQAKIFNFIWPREVKLTIYIHEPFLIQYHCGADGYLLCYNITPIFIIQHVPIPGTDAAPVILTGWFQFWHVVNVVTGSQLHLPANVCTERTSTDSSQSKVT